MYIFWPASFTWHTRLQMSNSSTFEYFHHLSVRSIKMSWFIIHVELLSFFSFVFPHSHEPETVINPSDPNNFSFFRKYQTIRGEKSQIPCASTMFDRRIRFSHTDTLYLNIIRVLFRIPWENELRGKLEIEFRIMFLNLSFFKHAFWEISIHISVYRKRKIEKKVLIIFKKISCFVLLKYLCLKIIIITFLSTLFYFAWF